MPLSGSHKRIVESKEAEANTRGAFGFADPGPVGLHRMVYTWQRMKDRKRGEEEKVRVEIKGEGE